MPLTNRRRRLAWHDRCTERVPRLHPQGEAMKITVWLGSTDRATWIAVGETLMLAYLLLQPGLVFRLLLGLPLLAHLGYTAMTSLPMGMIPRRPEGSKQARRNQDLRSWVVRFLNEVKELEDYLWRARSADSASSEVSEKLRLGRQRVMAAASEVAKAVGSAPLETEKASARGAVAGLPQDMPA